MKKKMLTATITCGLLLIFSGCTITAGGLIPNTKFAFPNSNVEPLGKVQVEDTKFSVLIPRVFSSTDVKGMYNDALKQKGGDLLINAKMKNKTTIIWIIYINKMTIEGTAAKMEVGKQVLH